MGARAYFFKVGDKVRIKDKHIRPSWHAAYRETGIVTVVMPWPDGSFYDQCMVQFPGRPKAVCLERRWLYPVARAEA